MLLPRYHEIYIMDIFVCQNMYVLYELGPGICTITIIYKVILIFPYIVFNEYLWKHIIVKMSHSQILLVPLN